jgi:hypothetical protein
MMKGKMKLCVVCGLPVIGSSRKKICGELCAAERNREQCKKRYHKDIEATRIYQKERLRKWRGDNLEHNRKYAREYQRDYQRRKQLALAVLKQLGIDITLTEIKNAHDNS